MRHTLVQRWLDHPWQARLVLLALAALLWAGLHAAAPQLLDKLYCQLLWFVLQYGLFFLINRSPIFVFYLAYFT